MHQNISKYNLLLSKVSKLLAICFIFEILFLIFAFHTDAAMPSSSNYTIQEYSFGSGGITNGTSTNFRLNGIAGEVMFGQTTSTNFKIGSGLTYLQTSHVPPAPTFTNPNSYYNKLHLVLATGNNASDTQFAIAISPDNFTTTTRYIQADMTLGTSPVWQTYTSWGGSSGTTIIGLEANTTYTVKVKARQGSFTESRFGPTAQTSTVGSTLSFSLSPNSLNLGQLTPGSVVTSGTQITATVTTNGTGGAVIYAYGSNNGLLSSTANYTINAVSNDLASLNEGYGLRAVSTNQSSGGPMQKLAPYNGNSDNVGIVDTSKRPLFDSTNQPVINGQGVFELKAKASNTTKPASDYADIITVIVSATF